MKFQIIVIVLLTALVFVKPGNAQHAHQNHNAMEAKEINDDHSLFHLDAVWTDHRDQRIQLRDFQGQPIVITMFYGNCTQVCPILIRDANRIYNAVDATFRDQLKVLAVTFDPENDTAEVLRNYAIEKELNIPQWHFVTGSSSSIRELAMMLGVQYTQKSDGHFAHSNLVTVLDGEGNIVHRLEGLNQPVDEAAEWIEQYLKKNL